MNNFLDILGITFVVITCLMFVSITIYTWIGISTNTIKEDVAICMNKDGVYVSHHNGKNYCFNKDAFIKE